MYHFSHFVTTSLHYPGLSYLWVRVEQRFVPRWGICSSVTSQIDDPERLPGVGQSTSILAERKKVRWTEDRQAMRSVDRSLVLVCSWKLQIVEIIILFCDPITERELPLGNII